MQIKDMKRTDWGRVLRKDYIARDFQQNGHQGRMSLSILQELTAPLTIHYPFGDVLIEDEGFGWLQIALKDQFFWITAMYDRQGQRINLYFDITAGNHFDNPDNLGLRICIWTLWPTGMCWKFLTGMNWTRRWKPVTSPGRNTITQYLFAESCMRIWQRIRCTLRTGAIRLSEN